MYCINCGVKSFKKNFNKLFCSECDFVLYTNVATASVLILEVNQEILFVIRKYDPLKGYLHLPGGFVNPEETLEEALNREVLEEINCKLKNYKYLFSIPNTYIYKEVNYNVLDMYFYLRLDRKPNIVCGSDADDFVWIPINEIDLKMVGFESVKKAISKIYLEKVV